MLNKYLQADIVAVQIARFYSNEFHKPFMAIVGDYGAYDVAALDQSLRIEIKAEILPSRTGNCCIEFWSTDFSKPSGILATKANRWLQIVPDGEKCVGYEFDVDILRKISIESGEVKSNGRNALCKIIPLAIIKKHVLRCIDLTGVIKLEAI